MRKLASWIDGFMDYSTGFSSPAAFRKWTAISIVAGALERKVWTFTRKANLYPNMFVFLVGPPGGGKTLPLITARRFWLTLEDYHIASTSVTKASLVDELAAAKRDILRPGLQPPHISYHSLMVPVRELSAFISSYDPEFMGFLTDIWDNHEYEETRRATKGQKLSIEHPFVNLIAATQPGFLGATLPEIAWEQGFLSRVMLVYSGEVIRDDIFTDAEDVIPPELIHDLSEITKLFGRFNFTEEARDFIRDWHMGGGAPAPEHPKLVNYNTRRTAHMLKLCMVLSAASGDDLTISVEHFGQALDLMVEMEDLIPEIFKGMSAIGDGKAIEEAWFFVFQDFAKKAMPVSEHRLYSWLGQKIPAHSVARVIENLERSKVLEAVWVGGVKAYKPGKKPGSE